MIIQNLSEKVRGWFANRNWFANRGVRASADAVGGWVVTKWMDEFKTIVYVIVLAILAIIAFFGWLDDRRTDAIVQQCLSIVNG